MTGPPICPVRPMIRTPRGPIVKSMNTHTRASVWCGHPACFLPAVEGGLITLEGRTYAACATHADPDLCPDCGHDGYDGHDMRSVPPVCMTPGCPCGEVAR
jgi:hypothetical protein